jgi:ADP-ribosylglycohydrolase
MSEKVIEIPGLGSVAPSSPQAARLGPLLGMAVGDALGTTFEFERIDQPGYPTLATGPARDVVGGGPFGLEPGQITDDTQFAVCLAHSIVAKGMPIDMLDLATRYVAWKQHAFDIGNQTGSALRAIEDGNPIATAARDVWRRSGRRAAGNGSLMRTAPIGVAFSDVAVRQEQPRLLVEAALTDSILTHADPRCALACAAFDLAIAHGVARPDAPSRTSHMIAGARHGLALAAEHLRDLWDDDRDDLASIDSAAQDLARDLDAAAQDDPQLYTEELHLHRTQGFVRVAFRLAFWHLHHTPVWRDALIDVASRGGDADTNGAIVGALLGARDGVQAIPIEWIDRVLAVPQPGPLEWANVHHPRHLLQLV